MTVSLWCKFFLCCTMNGLIGFQVEKMWNGRQSFRQNILVSGFFKLGLTNSAIPIKILPNWPLIFETFSETCRNDSARSRFAVTTARRVIPKTQHWKKLHSSFCVSVTRTGACIGTTAGGFPPTATPKEAYSAPEVRGRQLWQTVTAVLMLDVEQFESNQTFHYTSWNTPKRVIICGTHLRVIAPGQHSSYQRNVTAVASRWQYTVFDSTRSRFEPQTARSRDERVWFVAQLKPWNLFEYAKFSWLVRAWGDSARWLGSCGKNGPKINSAKSNHHLWRLLHFPLC